MSSVSHVCLANQSPSSTTNISNFIWLLTRAMKRAGWQVKASSDGTTKVVSDDPQADKLNSVASYSGVGGITNAGGAGMTIATASNGRSLVTGLTGLVTTAYGCDKGRFLVDKTNSKSYQIVAVVSATSCYIDALSVAVTTGSSLSWEIRDPTTDTYPALSTANFWACFRGPSVMAAPITSVPALYTGENVSQAATGFEGEVRSVSWDPLASTGVVLILPRVRGSGGGRYGTSTAAVVGDKSGVSFTPSAAFYELAPEFVIGHGYSVAANNIKIAGCWYNLATDSADMFSTLASAAGCTATVPPGGGGAGNSFPSSYLFAGKDTSTAYQLQKASVTLNAGKGQIMVADAIPEEDLSADGSFNLFFWNNSFDSAATYVNPMHGFWCSFVEQLGPGDTIPWDFSMLGPAHYGQSAIGGGPYAITTYPGTTPISSFGSTCFKSSEFYRNGYVSSGVYQTAHPVTHLSTVGATRRAKVGTSTYTACTAPVAACGSLAAGNSWDVKSKGRLRWVRHVSGGLPGTTYSDPVRGAAFLGLTSHHFEVLQVSSEQYNQPCIAVGPWSGAAEMQT